MIRSLKTVENNTLLILQMWKTILKQLHKVKKENFKNFKEKNYKNGLKTLKSGVVLIKSLHNAK